MRTINLAANADVRAGDLVRASRHGVMKSSEGYLNLGRAVGDAVNNRVQVELFESSSILAAEEPLVVGEYVVERPPAGSGRMVVWSGADAGTVWCALTAAKVAGESFDAVPTRSTSAGKTESPTPRPAAAAGPATRTASRSPVAEDPVAEVDRRVLAKCRANPGMSKADGAMAVFREDPNLQHRLLRAANPGHRIAGGATDNLNPSANPGVCEFESRVAAEERAGLTHSQAIAKVSRAEPVLHGRYLAGINPGVRMNAPSTVEKLAAEKQAADRFAARVRELEREGKLRSVAIRTASIESRADHEAWVQAQNPHLRLA